MPTKTLLAILSLLIVALLGIIVYGVMEVRSENMTASTLENQAAALAHANTLAQSIRDQKNASAENLAALDDLTLTQDKLVPFIEQIEDTGKSLGLKVTIDSVASDKPKPASASSTPVHVTVSTIGSWLGSFGFVHALENLPQHVEISETSLEADSGTDPEASATWRSHAVLTVYSFAN